MENEITAISNVKKEKEEFIKNKLSEWCKEQSGGKNSTFANNITILEIMESDIYKIDFKTRFVRRSFLEQIMPFEGQNIPKEKGNLPDLWAYVTANINHSGEDVEEITKDNYCEVEKKYEKFESFDFWNLFEKEKENLSDNDSKEYVPSKDDIKNLRQRSFEENAACYSLPETFELSVCPKCVGKGKVICYKCEGSGRVLNYDNKRVYCPKCEGARKLICGTCDGKGKVINYTGLTEFFTFSKTTKFLKQNFPSIFFDEIKKLQTFRLTDRLELTQNNYKEILSSNETLSNNSDLSKSIFEFIQQTGNQLEDNQRVNKYTIDISNLKTLIVKYDFNGKEYTIVLFGDNYEICAPEGTYPEEIRKIETKINKNKINKTLENLDASKKSRLSTLLLCLLFGLVGVHRFYVGKIGSGLLQAVPLIFIPILVILSGQTYFSILLLLCPIWYLVDLFFILVGKFKDKEDRYIKKWF